MKSTTVRLGQKIVGEYFPQSKTFTKKVRRSVHLFRKLNAWGIDSRIIEALKSRECRIIRIWDREEKRLYEISLKDWVENSRYLKFDFGLQSFCALGFFDVRECK